MTKLGAHLEAYANLLPTINTLRLSARYGKGPQVAVTMLPPELTTLVEDFLIAEERNRLLDAWTIDFKCYQMLCDPVEHLTEVQSAVLTLQAAQRKIPEEQHNLLGRELNDKERVCVHLDFNPDLWRDIHWERCLAWGCRAGHPTAGRRGIFTKHNDLIKKHFGLEVWVSHVRLKGFREDNFWETLKVEPAHTTVAFLKLPGAKQHFIRAPLTNAERDKMFFHIENGFGMPVEVPPPLSRSDRAKFSRMMRVLDLKPYVDDSQAGLSLAVKDDEGGDSSNTDAESCSTPSAEPKITILMRHNVRSDEKQ